LPAREKVEKYDKRPGNAALFIVDRDSREPQTLRVRRLKSQKVESKDDMEAAELTEQLGMAPASPTQSTLRVLTRNHRHFGNRRPV
jgi:hypothetical protein